MSADYVPAVQILIAFLGPQSIASWEVSIYPRNIRLSACSKTCTPPVAHVVGEILGLPLKLCETAFSGHSLIQCSYVVKAHGTIKKCPTTHL